MNLGDVSFTILFQPSLDLPLLHKFVSSIVCSQKLDPFALGFFSNHSFSTIVLKNWIR